MSLHGFSEGRTRQEIRTRATEQATTYYGTGCVKITLSNERATEITFSANWEAEEKHRWETPTYGFPKCVQCNKRSDEL